MGLGTGLGSRVGELAHDEAPDADMRPSVHALHLVAPLSDEYLPATQGEQLVEPVAVWFEPAAQLVQLLASKNAPYFPAVHFVQFVAASLEYWPIMQLVQANEPLSY